VNFAIHPKYALRKKSGPPLRKVTAHIRTSG
jgi:hypothetical protein